MDDDAAFPSKRLCNHVIHDRNLLDNFNRIILLGQFEHFFVRNATKITDSKCVAMKFIAVELIFLLHYNSINRIILIWSKFIFMTIDETDEILFSE